MYNLKLFDWFRASCKVARSIKLVCKTVQEIQEIFASLHSQDDSPEMDYQLVFSATLDSQLNQSCEILEWEGAFDQAMTSSISPKVIGLNWNPDADTFHFDPAKIIGTVSNLPSPPTKSQIFQISSRIFDPVGFLSPVTVVAKSMFQELWEAKLD